MRIIVFFLLSVLIMALPVRAEQRAGIPYGHVGYREIESLRTARSETYTTGAIKSMTRIYAGKRYSGEGGDWTRPDYALKAEDRHGFPRAVRTGAYVYRSDPLRPERGGRFECDDSYIIHRPTGEWTGKRVAVKPGARGVKEMVILERGAEPSVSWRLETNTRMTLRDGVLVCEDGAGRAVFRMPRFEAWDSKGWDIPVETVLEGSLLTCELTVPPDAAWPVFLDPTLRVGDIDDKTGALIGLGNTFSQARDTTTAYNNPESYAWVGVLYSMGTHTVHRSALVFDTSVIPDDAIIDSARVLLVTFHDGTDSDFNMKLAAAKYAGGWSREWFNDFPGWTPGAAYPVAILSATLNTATCHTPGDTCRFSLNAAGLDSIKVRGETQFMLLCERDINNQGFSSPYQERMGFEEDSPTLEVWYHFPVNPPSGFTVTAVDTATVACSWQDNSVNEQRFYIVNAADSSVVDSTGVGQTSITIGGLSPNTRHIWAVAADSAGVRGYSGPDTVWTLIAPPQYRQVRIRPVSSDTLRVTVPPPPNPSAGLTGLEVDALDGPGATDSGWMNGGSAYYDGGLDPGSAYVYRVRYRNGGGEPTAWSPPVRFALRGRTVQTFTLSGDGFDDYTANGGPGMRDSTVVRAGRGDDGSQLDGFLSFRLPWDIRTGGVDSLFLSLTRTGESAGTAPTLKLSVIPDPDIGPVEALNPSALDTTGATASWTIGTSAGAKRSPNLRSLIRQWQDRESGNRFAYGFGLRLDDNNQSPGVRAVFLDASHPDWHGGTTLTVHYTPGAPDTLWGGPEDFSLVVLAPDSIRASWEDGASGEYGWLLLNLTDSTRVAGTDTLEENSTSLTVGGLIPNTVHQWMVQAITPEERRTSPGVGARTLTRTPGRPAVTAGSVSVLRFVLDPRDNPSHTEYAVQDSVTGWFADPDATPPALRPGPLSDWGWRTFGGWGGTLGDSLTGLSPNTLHVLRVKAR